MNTDKEMHPKHNLLCESKKNYQQEKIQFSVHTHVINNLILSSALQAQYLPHKGLVKKYL